MPPINCHKTIKIVELTELSKDLISDWQLLDKLVQHEHKWELKLWLTCLTKPKSEVNNSTQCLDNCSSHAENKFDCCFHSMQEKIWNQHLTKYSNNRIIPILLVQLDIGKVMIFYKIFGNILTSHAQWYVHYAWSKPQLAFQFILFQIILKNIENLMWTELHLTAPRPLPFNLNNGYYTCAAIICCLSWVYNSFKVVGLWSCQGLNIHLTFSS